MKTQVKCIFRRGWRAQAAESKSAGSCTDTTTNSFDSTLWSELHNRDIKRTEEPIGVTQYECGIEKWNFYISKTVTLWSNGHIHHPKRKDPLWDFAVNLMDGKRISLPAQTMDCEAHLMIFLRMTHNKVWVFPIVGRYKNQYTSTVGCSAAKNLGIEGHFHLAFSLISISHHAGKEKEHVY